MIFCFFTASYDIDFKLIEDRKVISINYLKGWFAIDLIATLPVSSMINMIQELDNLNINSITRLIRLSRISRVIRVFRLIKVINIF